MAFLIGIDIGTSQTKTALFNEHGETIASKSIEYPMYQPKNGWAEQDPEDWKSAVLESLQYVMQASKVDPDSVKGIGLSGQMHGLVLLDDECRVIRPAILWCDQRTAQECEEITERIGKDRLIKLAANPALTGFTAPKILWVRNNEPENYAKTRHILLPKDYIRYILTGEFATEVSDASGMLLLDVVNRRWSSELCRELDIDISMLPKLYESPEITGYITREISEKTCLSVKTPVVGGAGDNAAAAVGTGVVTEGTAFTTIGSSGVVYAHLEEPAIDPAGRVHTFCSAVPGQWHVMGVTQGAGLSLKWFRDNFCSDEVALAAKQGVDPYEIMGKLAESVPLGSEKLLFLPYLMGERTPHLDPNARGVFLGISALHQKSHFIRAIMEGVAFSQRDSLDVLRSMGTVTREMILVGGGARSTLWRTILCDLYGVAVRTLKTQEGPALGAAILAGAGAGIYSTVQSGVKATVLTGPAQEPNSSQSVLYNKYYELYKRIYPALKPEYRALSDL